jgi:hypothetical protein
LSYSHPFDGLGGSLDDDVRLPAMFHIMLACAATSAQAPHENSTARKSCAASAMSAEYRRENAVNISHRLRICDICRLLFGGAVVEA